VKTIAEVFQTLGIEENSVHFDVHIVSSEQIRELNREHRNKDKATDVLSFPMLNLKEGQKPNAKDFPLDINPETGKIELGDIVINIEEENKEELAAHGLLHLLGYHHDDHEEEHE